MHVLVIQNCELEDLGLYAVYMREHGIEVDIVHAYRSESEFGPVADYDALFVGGTPLSIREVDQHPFLQRESDYLSTALHRGTPCFGICGGAQLVARVLGAEVRRSPVMEIGCYEVRLTPDGGKDPLLRGFPSRFPVFLWHGDMFDVPDGGLLLVEGEACRNQLFRRGTTVGVLFHAEVTAADVALWADPYAHELNLVRKDKQMVVEECRKYESQMRELCNLLMDNFFALIG